MEALPRPASSLPLFNLLLITALFVCLTAGVVSAWRTLVLAEQQQSMQLQDKETQTLARQIETHFTYQTSALQRLALRWDYQRGRKLLWQRDANQLLTDFSDIYALEWLDSNYRMQWRVSADQQPASAFDYPPTHPNMPYLLKARDEQRPMLSSHFELRQGGAGLAYYVPLYRNVQNQQHFDGYLIGIFKVEQLLNNLLYRLPTEYMSLVITDGKQPIFERTQSDTLDPERHLSTPLQLGNNQSFFLHTYPGSNMGQRYRTAIPSIALVAGLLASLLLCYALWLALLSIQRLAALKTSNRALQSEIRRRQQTEITLQQSQSRLQLILDMTDYSSDALFILSLDPLNIFYMNRPCWRSIGYTEKQLRSVIAINANDVIPGAEGWLTALRAQVSSRRSATYQRRVRARSGKIIPLEINIRPLNRLGQDYLVCMARNNRTHLETTAQLEKLSQLDGLTGLFNRRYFDAALDGEWRRLQRQQLPLGMLMVDVDFFKLYNDTLGHQAGDDVLRQISTIMQLHVGREGERVCRYGGEEFALLLPGADINQCHRIANLLLQATRNLHLEHPKSPFKRITISIGIASMIPSTDQSAAALVAAADQALYLAKADGRNRSADSELS